MKKKGKKPIIKSKVIIEGNTENSFMKNKLPKIIHDLEKFTKQELQVILSPSLNVSTTNIFKNFEPLPKETPRKNLRNLVSSTPYCGRYVNTQFTANSSLPSPIDLGSFNRNRLRSDNRKVAVSSSESSSVVYVGTEVNNSLSPCKNIKEELRPVESKSSNLSEKNRSVETSGQEQLKTNETHVQSKSSNNKQKMLVEASYRGHKGQNQVKQDELVYQSAQESIRDARFSKASNKKKKAEVSLKSTTAMTKHKELLKDHTQSSFKVNKRHKKRPDASDQDSLESAEIAGSQPSHPKTNNRNISINNNSGSQVTRTAYRSPTKLTKADAKKQFAGEESGIVPLKINGSRSRLSRSRGLNNSKLKAVEECKDFGRSGKINLKSKQMVNEPIEVQFRTDQVNTEIPPPIEGRAGKQSDKEESSIVSLKHDESRSRYVTSRSKKPDGTFRAAEQSDDFGRIREVNLEPMQMVVEPIDVQRKTVQANTQTSPPSRHYMSAGKRKKQNGFKGSFKDVLIEMERQARLKFTASVPAWTQTSGLTFGDNINSDNDVVGLGADIIQEITAKKAQMMCNTVEKYPIMSEAVKVDKSCAAVGPNADESRAGESMCKTPLLNNSARQLNEGRNVDNFTESFKNARVKINEERLISFESLINKLEAKALLAQEEGENSDSAISFNRSMSSNRRFKLPKKSSLGADENLEFPRCSRRHNKSRASAKKNSNSIIDKLVVKGATRKKLSKKSTQTSCLDVELLQVNPVNQKPENVAPPFRRSAMKQSCEHLKNLRDKSSVSNWENSTKQSEPSAVPNIYDSVREGNVADCLNFSALSDACFAEYLHKPWRCPEVSSNTDTFPRLSFIRPEAAIVADALHKFDDDSGDELSDFDVNRTLPNNNVSLAPTKVSASKGRPHYRRYSKYKANRNRKSKGCKKVSLSGCKVQNNLVDGTETEAGAERNVSPEIIRKAGKCSLEREQDVSEIRQDEVVSQILRPSTSNLASNSETADSWTRNKTLDGINNTVNGTLTSKSPTSTRVNSVASIPKSWNNKNRRGSKNKGNRDASPIISQQTPQEMNEETNRSSPTRLISNKKHQGSLYSRANESKTEMPSSSIVRLQSCSLREEDENLQPATSKKARQKRSWYSKNSTVDSFSKSKAYSTIYPLADISESNIIGNSGTGRSMRVRNVKTFEMPEKLEKDGFVFSKENHKLRTKSRSSTQKTKKRVSKKSSILEHQRCTLQETIMEGALSPIVENDVNEDVIPEPTNVNENRFSEMPPPRTLPPKRKILAVKNGEVSVDSGFETSNAGRKVGKTPRGCLKRKAVNSDVAGSSDSERDFRVSEQESNVLSRISSPIHNTLDSLEPDGNSVRTHNLPAKSPLRVSTRKKRSLVSPLNKYKKFGNTYIYKLYNTPDKQCEVGYLRLEGGKETEYCVFGDYASVAFSVKLGTGFVTVEDKSFPAKIDDWFHVFKGQKYTIRNTGHDQYLKLVYTKLR